jgi:predicted lipoprotein with Yx(FWY)xxD motif
MQASSRRRRNGTAALITTVTLALAALLLAACGTTSAGGSAGAGVGAGSSNVNTSLGPTGTVGAAHTPLGTVLVDSHGRTLYELSTDSAKNIVCVAVCASLWPPDMLPSGAKPVAGGGVEATLASVQRPDGTWQVTADGHPLYTYSRDGAAGQTRGQGVMDTGGTWHALSASGSPVMSGAGGSASSSSKGYGHY